MSEPTSMFGHQMAAHEQSGLLAHRTVELLERLGEDGTIDVDRIRAAAEDAMSRDGLGNARRIVTRAWSDPEFKARLLADGSAVREVLGYDMSDGFVPHLMMRVLENSSERHNVVVCTLCSCYPVAVFGPPPSWYKSEAYRSQVVIDSRAVLAQFGLTLPDETEVVVWDSTSEIRYFVLPQRPEGTEGWSEEQLAELVTQECIIGTGLPRRPGSAT